ncbi:MAG TPA: site-specific integrase [Streptosporangiaceae bacterium]|nr:site-specific integrase [Streptosporangiaceae bacterium]
MAGVLLSALGHEHAPAQDYGHAVLGGLVSMPMNRNKIRKEVQDHDEVLDSLTVRVRPRLRQAVPRGRELELPPRIGGVRLPQPFRYGYPPAEALGVHLEAGAKAAAEHVGELLSLAPDVVTRARIGGLIASARRGAMLKIGGEVTTGRPKSKAGERTVWLDQPTTDLLKAHREQQYWQRLTAGEAWQDHDLLFCKDDGQPLKPDAVSRRFKVLARRAGLEPIRLQEGRHSAASRPRDAEVDPEIRRKTLGHADATMTSHYTYIEQAAHKAAAEAVAQLVEEAGS